MAYCYSKKCFTGFIILMLFLVKTSFAVMQDTTVHTAVKTPGMVTGKVIDQDARPLKGAIIAVKQSTTVATTDIKGNFEIKADIGNILVFSYPDHNVKEVKITGDADLTVRLLDNYLQSPQTTDILYGTVKQANSLGAVSTIYTNQLTTTPASLYLYALPGQLPGLYTQQYSGFTSAQTNIQTTSGLFTNVVTSHNVVPNDNSEISMNIRGQGVITIIDGVQRELSSIDPESIESVSVLKDALSNILLGINSSNGVLLVTTKKGKAGAPRISFTAQTGVQQSMGLPTPLPAYQYAYLYNEALQNDNKPTIYSAADFAAYRNHSDPYGHPDVNWFKTLLNEYSPMTSYKLNINGGTETARYTISLNSLDQGGIFKTASSIPYNTNNDLSRYVINSNLSVDVTKKFKVELQLFGRIQQGTEPGAGYSNILSQIYGTPNNAYPVYNPNGSFGGTAFYTNNLLSQTEYSGYVQTNSHDVLANLDLNYDLGSFIKGLSFKVKGNLSIESQTAITRNLQNQGYLYNVKDSSYAAVGTTVPESNEFHTVTSTRYSFGQGALNYERQFGKNNVSAMLLADVKSVSLTYDLGTSTTNRAFKVGYNYDEKYFIEGAVNNSGYNRYPPGHQYGWFYAGGIGWQMGKERFIKDNFSWIDSWKWRATYGKTGNANVDSYGYFEYTQTYTSTYNAYPQGTDRSVGNGYVADPLANPNISWENAHKFDIGADISLFKDRFKITADYYHDKYYDLLQSRGNSIALLGTNYPAENLGINLYKGFELSLTYLNHISNFNYFITGNISIQSSKVLFADEEPLPYPWIKRTGQPVGTTFGYTALGYFQTAQQAAAGPTTVGYTANAGDIRYKDLNDDGVINQFDMSPIAGTKPLIFFGTTIGFNYNGFNVSAIVQGVTNRQISINDNQFSGFNGVGQFGNQYIGQGYDALTTRWTPETANTAELPRLSLGNANNTATSSFWIRSGDYLRLKNAEVGYTLPYSVSKKLRLSSIKVFVNGENLATLSGFKGIDPEVYFGNPLNPNPYPIQRVINAGVSVKL
ncbi:MAG: SusC/RagA family TonB-linked outer membrane protein [Mucilaginibacter sp.]|nr:SusC/RagA family TonB-linked outer membrane protein [Mucilaginibacter sp.]